MTKTELFQLICIGGLPAVLNIVRVLVAHSAWSCRVYFFPLTEEHFILAGVPLVTEVALLLTVAFWNGYIQVLDHNPYTIINCNGFQTIQL